MADWAKANAIDYVVVAPDDPLCLGLTDLLRERGIPSFGPSKAAARIEGSKVFAKKLMRKYAIPTAECEIFSDQETRAALYPHRPLPHGNQGGRAGAGQGRHHLSHTR